MTQDNTREALAEPVCSGCNGSGTVRASTTHLGEDDYEYDEECAACNGSGSPDLKDALESVGLIRHPQWPTKLYMNREQVMRIVEARAALSSQPPAPSWQPIETAPKDLAARLYLANGITLQGFVDVTGALLVQNERRGWRAMRIKPTHWMPLPSAPSTEGAAG